MSSLGQGIIKVNSGYGQVGDQVSQANDQVRQGQDKELDNKENGKSKQWMERFKFILY